MLQKKTALRHLLRKGLANVAVILLGDGVDVSRGTVHAIAEHGTSTVFCDWKFEPVAAVSMWSRHSRVGARQLAQYTATAPQRKKIWKNIVQSKITGQSWVMRTSAVDGWEHMLDIAQNVRSGDTGNSEAIAAAFYWKRVFGKGFYRDRTSEDQLNMALNYGYTVLRSRAISAVVSGGLHPGLGVSHHGHGNPFSLADDLIEPFRPAVDSAIARMPNVDMSDPETRKELVAASTYPMGRGQKTVFTEMVSLSRNIGMFLEDKSRNLHVPVWLG